MKVIRWNDLEVQPWRNGGGATREIFAARRAGDQFDWRVSVADVTCAGPFSLFPGYERAIMPLATNRMRLLHNGELYRTLEPLLPFYFDGGMTLEAELPDGPVTDFNLIMRQSFGRPKIVIHRIEHEAEWPIHPDSLLVYCIEGFVTVSPGAAVLSSRDSLTLSSEAASLRGNGLIALCGTTCDNG